LEEVEDEDEQEEDRVNLWLNDERRGSVIKVKVEGKMEKRRKKENADEMEVNVGNRPDQVDPTSLPA
jgi:hypothetical protein